MTNGVMAQPERGFATGELVVLRPVLEEDLPELAQLLAANPCDNKQQPWTLHRLKKEFEDKDSPNSGCWGEEQRLFTVARQTGEVVGFIKEQKESNVPLFWNRLYIGEPHPDRHELGVDAAKAYLAYKCRWYNPPRITFDAVRAEPGVAEYLAAAGFELEIVFEELMLYRGQPTAYCGYTWFSDYLKQHIADDGPVAGEEEE
jgi:RimJ/RimL family protein N-acetyltransferase